MINLSKESKTQDNPDLELIRKKILVKDLSWFPDLRLTTLDEFSEQQLTTQNQFWIYLFEYLYLIFIVHFLLHNNPKWIIY